MLRVLFVEDSEADAALTLRELTRAGFEPRHRRVQDAAGLVAALAADDWDLILSDEHMPGFDARQAIEILQGTGRDIPLIVVSGTIGEEAAVGLMKAGAQDFVLKDHLARLAPAVRRELREAERRAQQRADARARVDAQRELERAHRRLSALSLRLLEAQESERAQVSRDLHDGVGQLLTALQLQIEALHRRASAAPDRTQLQECVVLVRQVLQHVRTLSLDLRPPQLDTLGLAAALRWFAERKLGGQGAPELHFRGDGLPALPPALETACFRIAQEAVTNVLRHAGATRVDIVVEARNGQLCLQVSDDGRGFDVAEQHERAVRGESSGLLNMQERAALIGGRLQLHSGPGGTRVQFEFPLEPAPQARA